MISDQSNASRTEANLAEEDHFQFVSSEGASSYIHEQNIICGRKPNVLFKKIQAIISKVRWWWRH